MATKITKNSVIQRLNDLVLDIGTKMRDIGQTLLEAEPVLPTTEYKQVLQHLRSLGLTASDIKVCTKIAEGKVDPRLCFCGLASSKVLAMSSETQAMLLSGAEFEIRTDEDEFKKVTWRDMDTAERAQLFGTHRNGKIVHWKEQDISGRSRKRKAIEYDRVRLSAAEWLFGWGQNQGFIPTNVLVEHLYRTDQLDEAIETLTNGRDMIEAGKLNIEEHRQELAS